MNYVLQVKAWKEFFESAKSQTFKARTQLYIPNKHGLGYRRLVQMKNGEAMFGAWIAMCQVLSRHAPDRNGWITEDGREDSKPLSASDIAIMTGFTERTVSGMLCACCSDAVGWVCQSTASIVPVDCQDTDKGPAVSLPLPSPSPSPLPSPLDISPEPPSDPGPKAGIAIPLIPSHGEYEILQSQVEEWEELYPGVDVVQTLREIRGWNLVRPARRKTRDGVLKHIDTWMRKEQNKA